MAAKAVLGARPGPAVLAAMALAGCCLGGLAVAVWFISAQSAQQRLVAALEAELDASGAGTAARSPTSLTSHLREISDGWVRFKTFRWLTSGWPVGSRRPTSSHRR